MMIFSQKIKDLWSMISGMKVTGTEFFKSKLTVHYPRKEVDNLDSYRSHCELVAKEDDPYTPKCIMCGICIKNCPSNCLSFTIRKQDKIIDKKIDASIANTGELLIAEGYISNLEKKPLAQKKSTKRVLESFSLNYSYCSLCGLCVQNCPVFSLVWSCEVYLIGHRRQDFNFDLLERLKNKAIATATKCHNEAN